MPQDKCRTMTKRILSFRKNKVVSLLKTDTGKLTMRLLNGVTLTNGHKKRSTAVLQPLLTLNLIL